MTSQLLVRLDGVRALHEAGVEVLCEPADMPWGERIAYLRDPEGNVVTLVTAGH
jgi:lactoylglutathione lyase